MLLIITSTGDRLFGFININDLERPWTLKILILSDFLAIFGCKRVNCDEMDGDRLRLPANRNCYRLSRVSWALLKLLVEILKRVKFVVAEGEDLVIWACTILIQSQSAMDRQTEWQTHTVRQMPQRQLKCVKHYILSSMKNYVLF